jgi:hypothetical protein
MLILTAALVLLLFVLAIFGLVVFLGMRMLRGHAAQISPLGAGGDSGGGE